jgi:trehalose/maltose hydrolase-like predicted phosphorylase
MLVSAVAAAWTSDALLHPPNGSADADWATRYAAANLLFSPEQGSALMPYVGNGYLAAHPIVPRLSELYPPESAANLGLDKLYVSGVFNGVAVQSPCEHGFCEQPVRAAVPVYRVALAEAPYETSGRYALDLERAVLLRRVSLRLDVAVEERWFAHLTRRQLLVHEITIHNTAGTPAELALVFTYGNASKDIDFEASTTRAGAGRLLRGAVKYSELPELSPVSVAVESNVAPANLTVAPGTQTTFAFFSAVATSLDSEDPVVSAASALSAALSAADGALLREHEDAWLQRWDQGGIEVGGDLSLAQAVNASMYYLLSSMRVDWPQGVAPGGLASNGYHGHVFWDQELWMTPTLILMQPELARSMLQYRLDRLAGARSKARSQGYAGHMWPCESAYSGYEVQGDAGNGTHSDSARGIGGEGHWGLLEQHWNSDISFAMWQYWLASGNRSDLMHHLEPALRGTAEWWVSRVENGTDGYLHVNQVMGPDENHFPVDDDVFTNCGARVILRAAVAAAVAAGRKPGHNWSDVADRIWINFDSSQQYHPEYAECH